MNRDEYLKASSLMTLAGKLIDTFNKLEGNYEERVANIENIDKNAIASKSNININSFIDAEAKAKRNAAEDILNSLETLGLFDDFDKNKTYDFTENKEDYDLFVFGFKKLIKRYCHQISEALLDDDYIEGDEMNLYSFAYSQIISRYAIEFINIIGNEDRWIKELYFVTYTKTHEEKEKTFNSIANLIGFKYQDEEIEHHLSVVYEIHKFTL